MPDLVITGGHVITPSEERFADVIVDQGRISAVGPARGPSPVPAVQTIDATGCYVTPGLVDLQVNGGPSCDLWADPNPQQLASLASELAAAGVTTILPTLITDDLEHLRKNIEFLERQVGPELTSGVSAVQEGAFPVRILGLHLEGPCLSKEKPGVHPPEHLQPLSLAVLSSIVTGSVKLMTLAPELDPSGESIGYLKQRKVVVSVGHSNATFQEAEAAFKEGATMMTHTFNALPGIHHRDPGAVTAALLDDDVMCCLICDGKHLSKPAVQLVLKTKGIARCILVTDIAHIGTTKGGLVGSSIMLSDAVRNVVNWKIASFRDAIAMASLNPARAMGWDIDLGLLAAGKCADLVIWDKLTLQIKQVIVRGKVLHVDLRKTAPR